MNMPWILLLEWFGWYDPWFGGCVQIVCDVRKLPVIEFMPVRWYSNLEHMSVHRWVWLKIIDTPNRWFPTKYDHSNLGHGWYPKPLSHCHRKIWNSTGSWAFIPGLAGYGIDKAFVIWCLHPAYLYHTYISTYISYIYIVFKYAFAWHKSYNHT